MLVVADTSPIIALINLDQINVLPTLFQRIVLPRQVAAELEQLNKPLAVRAFIENPPAWLVVRTAALIERIPDLDSGEEAAISLAREVGASLVLMDDAAGRKAARARRLTVTGTVGILERAARQGLLDLEAAFNRLRQTDFWVTDSLLATRLRLHQQRTKRGPIPGSGPVSE